MTDLVLRVNIEGMYEFEVTVWGSMSILQLTQHIQALMNTYFTKGDEAVMLFSLQDQYHRDIHPGYLVNDVFDPGDVVYPLRNVLITQFNKTSISIHPILLSIPDDSNLFGPEPITDIGAQTTNVKCLPYCLPLSPFGVNDQVCPICGEIKAYPCKPEFKDRDDTCTEYCLASGIRKPRSLGLDFCSICLGRRRKGKYIKGQQHQCNHCHRPWLRLTPDGLCRSCHVALNGKQSPPHSPPKAEQD